MPSYPASVKSFTTKNTGDVIQAAHVNDIQDEVNAIEAGLRNGTAPLNAAGSTLTSLSVTGNSTLAALQGGASTLASLQSGASTFSVRPVTPPPEMALVFLDSIKDVGSSALSTLSFTGESLVSNSSMHSTGTNPNRLVPQSTGVYVFALQVALEGAPSAGSLLRLYLVDSTGAIFAQHDSPGVLARGTFQVEGIKRFDVLGGYVSAEWQNVSGGSTHSLTSGAYGTRLSMVKL